MLEYRRRVPNRPVTVTIILALVLGFMAFSKSHDLDAKSARLKVKREIHADCSGAVRIGNAQASEILDEEGRFDRFEVTQSVTFANGKAQNILGSVWPDITIGPRIPTGGGDYFALMEFNDIVELSDLTGVC
jgi:hypothetical protein